MWFGAVSVDCAVFFAQNTPLFAFLIWQTSCSLHFANMKSLNVLLAKPPERILACGCRYRVRV